MTFEAEIGLGLKVYISGHRLIHLSKTGYNEAGESVFELVFWL
jgi:hypothetical protein